MISRKIARTLFILCLIIMNIGCDQVTKSIVRKKLVPYSTINLLNNHLTITKIENTGAFLSAGNSLSGPLRFIILSLLPLGAMILGFIYIFSKPDLSPVTITGICFIIGGGIGNIFDRIVHGSVTDFLHIRLGGLQTGIFNMADVSIMTGTALIILCPLLKKKNQIKIDESSQE